MLLLLPLLLSGCSDKEASATPLDWWHNLEGGVIATQRPPPPGVNDPYPNIATIPPRPPAADVAGEQAIADSLAAQRDSANQAAASDPVKALPPAPPPPKPAAPDPNANKVVVDAATPAPAAAPPAAPTPAVSPAVASSVTPDNAALPGIGSVPAVPDAVASGPLPDFAAAPPLPPAGFDLPASTPTTATPVSAPKAPPVPANSLAVAFTPQSSTLPPSAGLRLQQFVQAHKGAGLLVTGRGDAVLRSADAQSRALDLALKRAQAMAAFLAEAGVPAANLHLRADATGDGGIVSLN